MNLLYITIMNSRLYGYFKHQTNKPASKIWHFLLFLYFAEAQKYRRSTKLWRHFAHKGRGGSVAYGSVAYVRTGPWTRPLMSRMNMDRAWCLMLLAPLAPHSVAGDSYGIRRAAF